MKEKELILQNTETWLKEFCDKHRIHFFKVNKHQFRLCYGKMKIDFYPLGSRYCKLKGNYWGDYLDAVKCAQEYFFGEHEREIEKMILDQRIKQTT